MLASVNADFEKATVSLDAAPDFASMPYRQKKSRRRRLARWPKKKHHPCLVPYEDLPAEEQQKDIDVVNNIIPLLDSIGLRVYRKRQERTRE